MALSSLTVSKIFQYVDQKRVYQPQDGSTGLTRKYRALSRVLWDLKNEFVLPWDEQTTTINYLDSVTDYNAPGGLDHVIAWVPDSYDRYFVRIDEKTAEEFRRMDNRNVTNISAVDRANQSKALLLKYDGQFNHLVLNAASDLTANGTWSADTSGSDATNLTKDKLTFKQYGASLNFDLDVSQSGNNFAQISNSTMTSIDLSDEEDVAHIVAEVYIPDTTNITSFTMRWGSDSSNYWESTVTTAINGKAFQTGWNTLDFDWSTATETGTGDSSAVDYVLFRVTYSASQTDDTDFRLNFIRAAMPESVTLRYSTAYIAKNSGGTLIDEISSQDDVMLFSQMDTKFMNTVIAGCLFELFGDNQENEGAKEQQWLRLYNEEKRKLQRQYQIRRRTSERRVHVRNTARRGYIRGTL